MQPFYWSELESAELLRRHYAAGGKWLPVSAVALRWSCHRSSVYRLLTEGALIFLRLGGKGGVRISSYWLAEYEKQMTAQAG